MVIFLISLNAWSWKWLSRFTKTNLGRMYPFGLRFDSSNADPMDAWKHGLQVAAVNMQGRDRPVWISQAFFSKNGGCGYVKKPDFLLPGSNVDPKSLQPKLELKVNLPQPIFISKCDRIFGVVHLLLALL